MGNPNRTGSVTGNFYGVHNLASTAVAVFVLPRQFFGLAVEMQIWRSAAQQPPAARAALCFIDWVWIQALLLRAQSQGT